MAGGGFTDGGCKWAVGRIFCLESSFFLWGSAWSQGVFFKNTAFSLAFFFFQNHPPRHLLSSGVATGAWIGGSCG